MVICMSFVPIPILHMSHVASTLLFNNTFNNTLKRAMFEKTRHAQLLLGRLMVSSFGMTEIALKS